MADSTKKETKSTRERAAEAAKRADEQKQAQAQASATSAVAGVSAQGTSAPTGDPDSKAKGTLEQSEKDAAKRAQDAQKVHEENEKAREDLAKNQAKTREEVAKGKSDAVTELAGDGRIGEANAALPYRGLVINPDEAGQELISALSSDPRAAGVGDAGEVVDTGTAATSGAHVRANSKGQVQQVAQFRTDF